MRRWLFGLAIVFGVAGLARAGTMLNHSFVAGPGLSMSGHTLSCPTFSSSAAGCVPLSSGGTTNFLRADGTWAAPSGGSASPGGSIGAPQYNSGGSFGGIPTIVNASTQSGADICAKISAAARALNIASPSGGIIDATNFTGAQTCAGSMFASWPGNGFWSTVLLGPAQITVSVSQVVPTRTTVKGFSPYNDSPSSGQAGGTAFFASGTFPISTPVIDLGPSNPAFAIQIDHIAIDCAATSGSIGLRNLYSQEQTAVDHINIRGCYTGMLLAATLGDTNTYRFLTIDDTGLPSTASSYECFQIGRPTDSDSGTNHLIGDVSYVSCGAYTVTAPTNFILLDGLNFAIHHIYVEGNAATNGINIGSQSAGGLHTRSVLLEDVSVSAANAVTLSIGINGPVTLMNITGGVSGSGGNLLNDTLSGGCVIPYSQETALGLYARGYAGRIISNSSYCPKP